MKHVDDFLLTDIVTVGQARKWMIDQDSHAKENLANLIYHRFYNRFIKQLKEKSMDSGFHKMAVSCCMIETLESFKQGVKNTHGKSRKMFEDFFRSEEKFFPGFKDIAADFYSDIRCGILHQSETTNAWRILRKGELLDRPGKTINATKFVKALDEAHQNYVSCLQASDFNTTIWTYAILKLQNVCDNCEVRR